MGLIALALPKNLKYIFGGLVAIDISFQFTIFEVKQHEIRSVPGWVTTSVHFVGGIGETDNLKFKLTQGLKWSLSTSNICIYIGEGSEG